MLKKTGLLYAAATVLYLPFAIYAGYYAKGSLVTNVLKMIFFDGTFYHLWYLPAVLIGVLLVWLLGRRCSLEILLIIAGMLYLLGLLGDSYYGVIQQIPWLEFTYQGGFEIFSYTRNGLFFAPIFLAMGAWIAQSPHRFTRRTNLIGFLVSMLAMLFEGMLLRQWDFLRHDSMYIALLPCVFFLCQLLLSCKGRTAKKLRSISMLIYILHPLFIIALRGIARIFNLTDLLIENSLVQYLVVCILSVACSVLLSLLPLPCKKKGFSLGRAWIELDLKNLRNNVSALQGLLPKTCQLMPAVKANAYGHGDIIICKELNRLAIRVFCVATVLEGVHLRQHGIKGDILVLSYTHPYQFHLLKRYRLMQTVIDAQYAALLNHYRAC